MFTTTRGTHTRPQYSPALPCLPGEGASRVKRSGSEAKTDKCWKVQSQVSWQGLAPRLTHVDWGHGRGLPKQPCSRVFAAASRPVPRAPWAGQHGALPSSVPHSRSSTPSPRAPGIHLRSGEGIWFCGDAQPPAATVTLLIRCVGCRWPGLLRGPSVPQQRWPRRLGGPSRQMFSP